MVYVAVLALWYRVRTVRGWYGGGRKRSVRRNEWYCPIGRSHVTGSGSAARRGGIHTRRCGTIRRKIGVRAERIVDLRQMFKMKHLRLICHPKIHTAAIIAPIGQLLRHWKGNSIRRILYLVEGETAVLGDKIVLSFEIGNFIPGAARLSRRLIIAGVTVRLNGISFVENSTVAAQKTIMLVKIKKIVAKFATNPLDFKKRKITILKNLNEKRSYQTLLERSGVRASAGNRALA